MLYLIKHKYTPTALLELISSHDAVVFIEDGVVSACDAEIVQAFSAHCQVYALLPDVAALQLDTAIDPKVKLINDAELVTLSTQHPASVTW